MLEKKKSQIIQITTDAHIIQKSRKKKGGIHLGSWEAVKNRDYLEFHSITHILSVIPKEIAIFENIKELKITQLIIDAKDSSDFKLIDFFEQAADFINNSFAEGNILVHCAAGISRSCSCLIGYFIKYRSMPYEDALRFIRLKRKQVNPNPGFAEQLKVFENRILK